MDVGNLISGTSAFSKSSLNIWNFLVHILLKPSLGNFENYFASVWDECNCVIVWTFFDIAFLWDWNENWPFPVLWSLWSFPNLLAYWVQQYGCLDHSKLWNILQEIRIPDHLTCLLRNQYAGQEATVRTRHGAMNWFKIEKGVHQGCILSPCLFNVYVECIMWNTELDESQAEIKIVKRNTDMQTITL